MLSVKNIRTVRKYVRHLLDKNIIQMTIPATPPPLSEKYIFATTKRPFHLCKGEVFSASPFCTYLIYPFFFAQLLARLTLRDNA